MSGNQRCTPPATCRTAVANVAMVVAGGLVCAMSTPGAVAHPAAASRQQAVVDVLHAGQVLAQRNDPDVDVMTQAVVAANPARPRTAFVVSEEGENAGGSAGIRYARTRDGGLTWRAGTVRGLTAATGGPWDSVGFSMVATGIDSEAYIAASVRTGECHTATAVLRSVDHGRGFGRAVLTDDSSTCWRYNAKPWVAVDTDPTSPYYGRVYLSVLVFHFDRDGNDVGQQQYLQYSDDRGATWSDRKALTPRDGYTHFNSVVVQPDGAVTVVYGEFSADDPPNKSDVVARTSRDGGRTFGSPTRVARNTIGFTGTDDTRCCMQVAAVDPVTGVLYVALMDIRFRDDDINDVLVFSSADGEQWGKPVVASRHQGEPIEHFTPSVGAYDGTVYVSWTARRATASRLSDRIRQQVAVSTDGGATFGPAVSLGPAGDLRFAAAAPNGFAPRFLSDYNTTVAVPGRAYTTWPLPTAAPAGAPHQTLWAGTVTTK